jgi:inorganic pyrophosphatase
MAKPIRGIEIFLPLEFNDGTPIPDLHYLNLQEELLRRFGGVTSVQRQFPLQGIWQNETDVYSDNIVVFSAMDFGSRTQLECLRYLQRLKGRLKKEFDQLEILITVNEMLAI